MSVQLRTNRVVVTFLHSDGRFAEAGQRAVRIVAEGAHKGRLGVERRSRILPIEVTGASTATCNLGADALVVGYADAQAVAPVATLEGLGVKREPKAPKIAAAATAKAPKITKAAEPKAPEAGSLDDAIAAVREHLKGKPLPEVQAIMTALVTAPQPKAASKGRRRR